MQKSKKLVQLLSFFRPTKESRGTDSLFSDEIGLKKGTVMEKEVAGYPYKIHLRHDTEDIPMFDGVFKEMEFDFPFDFKPKVIIDCGGHIGLAAIYFANKYPSARIFSIEPEQSNFQMLLLNTKNYSNITCLNCGVWNEPSKLEVIDVNDGNWAFQTKPAEGEPLDSIEAITIPSILAKYNINHIDICKINIEGAEKELFEKNYEEWMSVTKAIIIELHDRMKEGCSYSFFKALTKYQFWVSWKRWFLVAYLKNDE